jgi:predicted metal-dependent HD superfamily phosphohydrolase
MSTTYPRRKIVSATLSPNAVGADFERWCRVCVSLNATRGVEVAYQDLTRRYQESARAYHSLEHIAKCLDEFDLLRQLAGNGSSVEFAIWFHDAVYDSRAADNEEKSAVLAEAVLRAMGIEGETLHTVGSLICLTKHDRAPTMVDEQIILDVDLAILGQSPEVFDKYESGVRVEYSWVSDKEFWSKRTGFLKSLLARERIFHTALCRQRYELAARKNLQRTIDRMASQE